MEGCQLKPCKISYKINGRILKEKKKNGYSDKHGVRFLSPSIIVEDA